MRKLFLLPAAFCLLFSLRTTAQERPAAAASSFGRNHFLLSLSYGFPARFQHSSYLQARTAGSTVIGPLILGMEIPVHDAIGIRTLLQYAQRKLTQTEPYIGGTTTYESSNKGFSIGVMGCYHFHRLIPVPRLDVYAGLGPGIAQDRETVLTEGPYDKSEYKSRSTYLVPMTAIGLRYYVLRRLAVFAEGGYSGLSYANAGLTLHLPN